MFPDFNPPCNNYVSKLVWNKMITGRGMPYEVKIDPLCLYDVWVGYDFDIQLSILTSKEF